MTPEQFTVMQHQLGAFGNLARGLDLDGFIGMCDQCLAVAPLIDPSSFIRNHRKVEEWRDLAASLKPFQQKARELAGGQHVQP